MHFHGFFFLYVIEPSIFSQSTIRHNLSVNKAFMRVPRPASEKGNGAYWRIDPNYTPKNKNNKKRSPVTPSPRHTPYMNSNTGSIPNLNLLAGSQSSSSSPNIYNNTDFSFMDLGGQPDVFSALTQLANTVTAGGDAQATGLPGSMLNGFTNGGNTDPLTGIQNFPGGLPQHIYTNFLLHRDAFSSYSSLDSFVSDDLGFHSNDSIKFGADGLQPNAADLFQQQEQQNSSLPRSGSGTLAILESLASVSIGQDGQSQIPAAINTQFATTGQTMVRSMSGKLPSPTKRLTHPRSPLGPGGKPPTAVLQGSQHQGTGGGIVRSNSDLGLYTYKENNNLRPRPKDMSKLRFQSVLYDSGTADAINNNIHSNQPLLARMHSQPTVDDNFYEFNSNPRSTHPLAQTLLQASPPALSDEDLAQLSQQGLAT
jgi:hypothetical protein